MDSMRAETDRKSQNLDELFQDDCLMIVRIHPVFPVDVLTILAAQLSSGAGDTQGNASLNLLSKDLDEGLSILREVLIAPRFQDDCQRRMAHRAERAEDAEGSAKHRSRWRDGRGLEGAPHAAARGAAGLDRGL